MAFSLTETIKKVINYRRNGDTLYPEYARTSGDQVELTQQNGVVNTDAQSEFEDLRADLEQHTHESAPKLATARAINGIKFDGSANVNGYRVCQTAGSTAAKTVAHAGFILESGAQITVKFNNTNTAQNPTLQVGDTSAAPITCAGAAVEPYRLQAGEIYTFVYNGTNFELVDGKVYVKYASTLPASVPADLAEGGILIVG